MKPKMRIAAVWTGLLCGLSATAGIVRMAYGTHSWLPGVVAIVIQVTATVLVFRSLRGMYLRLGPESEASAVENFNRKAVAFGKFNVVLLAMWTFTAAWVLGWLHR